ncbi:DH domain-containing protein [Plasmodiophora brassicae]|nr:hypothetical protein PBRA_004315 [Plasmodiophora brassicae]
MSTLTLDSDDGDGDLSRKMEDCAMKDDSVSEKSLPRYPSASSAAIGRRHAKRGVHHGRQSQLNDGDDKKSRKRAVKEGERVQPGLAVGNQGVAPENADIWAFKLEKGDDTGSDVASECESVLSEIDSGRNSHQRKLPLLDISEEAPAPDDKSPRKVRFNRKVSVSNTAPFTKPDLVYGIVSELLQSERSYLDALLQLGQLVLTPLEKALRDANPTTATVIQRLLNLHRIIYSSQKRFFCAVRDRSSLSYRQGTPMALADVFLMEGPLFSVYRELAALFDDVCCAIFYPGIDGDDFARPVCTFPISRTRAQALLRSPLERVCSYQAFAGNLRSLVDEGIDRDALDLWTAEAADAMHDAQHALCSEFNREKIEEFEQRIGQKILRRGRVLIRADQVTARVGEFCSDRFALLFDDRLLLCDNASGNGNLTVVDSLDLKSVKLVDDERYRPAAAFDNTDTWIHLVVSDTSSTLSLKTGKVLNKLCWMHDLRQWIAKATASCPHQ